MGISTIICSYDKGLSQLIFAWHKSSCQITQTVEELLGQVNTSAKRILIIEGGTLYENITPNITVLALSGTPKPLGVTKEQFRVFETDTFLSVIQTILNPSSI